MGRMFEQGTMSGSWRTFEVTTRVEVLKSSGTTRVWVPTALIRQTPFQKTLSNEFNVEGGTANIVESKADALGIIAAEFPAGVNPILAVTSRIATKNCAVDLSAPSNASKANAAELDHFLRPTKLLPTDGIVKATAAEITSGAKTDVEMARDLRVDRGQHVSESQDARMRRRRHPLHAGVQGSDYIAAQTLP
jgi:hypothetical protein